MRSCRSIAGQDNAVRVVARPCLPARAFRYVALLAGAVRADAMPSCRSGAVHRCPCVPRRCMPSPSGTRHCMAVPLRAFQCWRCKANRCYASRRIARLCLPLQPRQARAIPCLPRHAVASRCLALPCYAASPLQCHTSRAAAYPCQPLRCLALLPRHCGVFRSCAVLGGAVPPLHAAPLHSGALHADAGPLRNSPDLLRRSEQFAAFEGFGFFGGRQAPRAERSA